MANVCDVKISGSSAGTTCVSYTNCDANCCDKTYGSCSGTTSGCPGKTQDQCTAMGACCSWGGGPPASCRNVTCVGMSESNCGGCAGCTKAGTCPKKTCGSVSTYDPTLCAGCNDCAGTITIDTGVATLPWDVKAKVVKFPTAIGLRFNTSYRLLLYN